MATEILKELLSSPLVYGLVASVIVLLLFIIELVIFKRFEIITIAVLIALVVGSFLIPTNKLYMQIIISVLSWILAGYSIYRFIVAYNIYVAYDKELNNFLKNNEFDFFIQTTSKDKIINYSNKLLKITKLPPRDIKGMHCWKLLMDYLKINKINKREVNLSTISEFIESYKQSNSKRVIYQFEFEMPKLENLEKENDDKTKDLTNIRYIGLVQPVYYRQKLIGRNIYFYQDRMQVLTDLRSALTQAAEDLSTLHNFVYIMMSLMDYIGLYFDYNTRTYVATESFVKFTRNHQKEYTFNQFMEMMHPDDVDRYIEESSTINSISVTRLKYRLLINEDYYYVLEDSININKDADLLSVIRILNKTDEAVTRDIPLSKQEVESVLDTLNTTDINTMMTKTENILNTVIGSDDEKN